MRVRIRKLAEVAFINPKRTPVLRPDNEPTSFIPMENVDGITAADFHVFSYQNVPLIQVLSRDIIKFLILSKPYRFYPTLF